MNRRSEPSALDLCGYFDILTGTYVSNAFTANRQKK